MAPIDDGYENNSQPARRTIQEWKIETARPEDAKHLASIQVSQFKTNELFKIQFPDPEVVAAYEVFLAERIRAEIDESHATVLVTRSEHTQADKSNDAAAFAVWRPPHPGEEADLHASKEWPKGTNVEMIRKWGDIVNEAYGKATGDRTCYRLDWLVTDSRFEGQGAGSILLKWGLAKATADKLPVYLESTVDSAGFYEKRGFKQVAKMSIALDADRTRMYHEVGLLWEP